VPPVPPSRSAHVIMCVCWLVCSWRSLWFPKKVQVQFSWNLAEMFKFHCWVFNVVTVKVDGQLFTSDKLEINKFLAVCKANTRHLACQNWHWNLKLDKILHSMELLLSSWKITTSINLILPETRVPGYIFVADSIGLSSCKFCGRLRKTSV